MEKKKIKSKTWYFIIYKAESIKPIDKFFKVYLVYMDYISKESENIREKDNN